MRTLALLVLLAAPPLASAQQPPLALRMLLAEDARAQTPAELAPLREGLNHHDAQTRRQAVRAIGRLERPDLIPLVTRVLADPNADVRAEAANAVGQLARGPKGIAAAQPRLLARARMEKEPRVWAVVAATLGRLPYTDAADVRRAEAALAEVLPTPTTTALSLDAVLGAVEGLEAMARQSGKIAPLGATTVNGLRAAAELEGRAQDADKLTRIRRLATAALTAAGAVTRPQLDAGVADADAEVRRLTMVAARAPVEGRESVLAAGLKDPQPQVRYEALQTWGRQLAATSCEPIVAAVADPDPHVSLLAIDLVGTACPAGSSPPATLRTLADALDREGSAWHAPAHALVALARTSPSDATPMLPRFAAHPIWQVRMYAARTAAVLADFAVLARLGEDAHDNVREAALAELITLKRPEAVRLALLALGRPDYQLVMTAARALTSPPARDEAVAALVDALARITAERRDTSRDARMAILTRLQELGADGSAGSRPDADALRPYLTDFDPAIAARAGEIRRGWQLPPATVAPRPLPRPAITQDAIDALRGARLRFTMSGRGSFEVGLLMDEAPLSSLRVAGRAREGYYDGLTFHRVAPNFVVQGGSPGANEYMGDGPYMRDEVGLLPHARGTLGISTRGRDTGDAQIFINLVDSPRLDHTYTVFAEVLAGMEVVDRLLEGDVIERVELLPPS